MPPSPAAARRSRLNDGVRREHAERHRSARRCSIRSPPGTCLDILADVPPPLNGSPGRIAYKTGTSYGYRDAWAIGL